MSCPYLYLHKSQTALISAAHPVQQASTQKRTFLLYLDPNDSYLICHYDLTSNQNHLFQKDVMIFSFPHSAFP